MLQVANLSKEYPTPRGPLPVLCDVSFALAPGEAAAIMGPSGSGKSSLLYLLGALEPPTSGTVTLDGRNPFQLGADELAAFRNTAIGFVFQDHCLLPQCSILENVLIPTLVAPAAENVAWLLLDLHRRQQTILVIVTHSAALAEKLPIRFELVDRQLRLS